MKKVIYLAVCMVAAVVARADSFGTFDIDFVSISGNASSANGTYIGKNKPEGFSDPGNYRMGTKEITNDQWTKFKTAYGTVTGSELNPYGGTAYDYDPYFTGSSVPTNNVSWYEAAQFVNWLNVNKGYQAAYKFTGTIHTSSYTLGVWGTGEADGTNLYRNKNAKYFLPTENEWVKAAYWNGTMLQTYATKAGESLYQGNGSNGGWNYYNNGVPWNVGSGSQELNGTYDMMGNVWEWMESPYTTGDYLSGSNRGIRGGSIIDSDGYLASSKRYGDYPYYASGNFGFRVASIVPEPCSLVLLGLGGLVLRYRKR